LIWYKSRDDFLVFFHTNYFLHSFCIYLHPAIIIYVRLFRFVGIINNVILSSRQETVGANSFHLLKM
jgi:hypothetical protein